MVPVILESPYSGDVHANEEYARACMKDSLERGEAPFLSHLLYTQVLDDLNAEERRMGMNAHHAWQAVAKKMVVYTDLGVSRGMKEAIDMAQKDGLEVEVRQLMEDVD